MNIQTVRDLGDDGYLVNGYLTVPHDSSNTHYPAVQEWIAAGNTPEPAKTAEELLSEKRGEVLKALESEFNSRMWVNIQTTDQSGAACAIQFRNDSDWRKFDSKSLAVLGKKLADPLATVTYRTEDNEVRTFLAADFYDLAQTVEAEKAALIYAYGDKRIEVNALSTLAELEAYDATTGWP